ncbi:hypothetical protein DPMN_074988 [Dreissena polymorpha]|uniref:Uncharacterized protein n=1 Tax=Dreissena polymorpha TaxID=45954 RepID=A0A9D4BL58_DREPO|nr:hypothetical protein DPMN_074988 [Dreissena polymorpha]
MMPADPRCVIRDEAGALSGCTGDDRNEPRLHRESIKMFNTSGKDRQRPARHRGSTWALPATTVALPGLHRDKP